jgi:tetratricopeptide (TPR) repeat protein
MYNIGLCHQLQGNLQEAIDCFRETLRIEKFVLGVDHKDVSMTSFKLGEVYKAKGDFDEALKSFHDALRIERKTIDQEDPAALARTINEIGNIHFARGDVVPMMEAFVEASRICRQAGLSSEGVTVSGELYHFGITCPNAAPVA